MNPKDASKKTKDKVHKTLKAMLESIGIDVADVADDNGPLGSHSVSKCTSTWAQSNGMHKDHREWPGCSSIC